MGTPNINRKRITQTTSTYTLIIESDGKGFDEITKLRFNENITS